MNFLRKMTSIVTTLSCLFIGSCGDDKDDDNDAPTTPTLSTPIEGLHRLTPEQLSRQLDVSLGFKMHHTANGYEFDIITDYLGLALGGVDFKAAHRRDVYPKTQTLLVVRTLALVAAIEIVVREYEKRIPESEFHFKDANMILDRPIAPNERSSANGKASQARWQKQLEYFYWRLFSRPPSATEIAAHKKRFVNMADIQKNVAFAWVGALYALISSMEFSHATH
jgi:hypothetical protein